MTFFVDVGQLDVNQEWYVLAGARLGWGVVM